jgi:hypothetical protein
MVSTIGVENEGGSKILQLAKPVSWGVL